MSEEKQTLGKQLITIFGNYKSTLKPLPEGETIGGQLLKKYPDRVPLIINSKGIPLTTNKLLMPGDAAIGYVMLIIRKHSRLEPYEAMYMFIENRIQPCGTDMISEIYHKHKNPNDDCLHVTITKENVFG